MILGSRGVAAQRHDRAGEHPWADLRGPEITLDQFPDALAGRLHDPPPAKYFLKGSVPVI